MFWFVNYFFGIKIVEVLEDIEYYFYVGSGF